MVVQKMCFLELLTPSKYLALKAIVTDHFLCQKCRISEKFKDASNHLKNCPINMAFTQFVYGIPYQRII